MVTTDKERLEHVNEFYKSGLMPVAFCKKHQLNVKTFYVWLKRYPINDDKTRLRPALMVEPSFLPLQIVEDSQSENVLTKLPITLSFKTKNFCLDIPLNIQENFADFRLLLQALNELV